MGWQGLESQAEAILPKTMQEKAMALLGLLLDGGYIRWRSGNLELIIDSMEIIGSDLLDLASHAVYKHCAEPLKQPSPGLPVCFAKFATALRCTNTRQELLRNRRCCPQINSVGLQQQVQPKPIRLLGVNPITLHVTVFTALSSLPHHHARRSLEDKEEAATTLDLPQRYHRAS